MNVAKVFLAIALIIPALLSAETLSVQVKKSFLRSKPSFLGKTVVKVVYAQQVEKKSSKNDWYLVKSLKSGKSGWIHSSALSTKAIVLSSSDKLEDSSVTQGEILMAGKGFNKEVEQEYKKQNSSMNFSQIDAIEKDYSVSRTDLIKFANNGKLNI